jgi:NADH-quinone oxidoreductase subunit N
MDLVILKSFLPEIYFSVIILFQLLFNTYNVTLKKNNFPIVGKEILFQTIFILVTLLILYSNIKIEGYFFNFLLLNDKSTIIVKCIITFFSILICPLLYRSFIIQKINFFEFFSIFFLSILSILLLISSYDFLSVYLVIEMQALCFYILASIKRDSAFSTEAGLKYFISGSFISGLFLFGCSLIYGTLGTLNLHYIQLLLSFPFDNDQYFLKSVLLFSLVLIFVSFFFKLAAVPFHFWAPDVYEGAPLSSTILFSVIPKVAIFHFLIKLCSIFSILLIDLKLFFLFIGFISILVGTLFAIRQKRLKRMLIYSSIVQVGFLISALSTGSLEGYSSIYFFLIIYMFTSIILWGFLTQFYFYQNASLIFEKREIGPIFLSHLSNLFLTNKVFAFSLVIVFFSIAGIPPVSGFLSKVLILLSLIKTNNLIFTLLIILISSVSVFYYLRVLKIVFFEKKVVNGQNKDIQTPFLNSIDSTVYFTVAISLYFLIFFFVFPDYLLILSQLIVLSSFGY